ncbi:MAG TPA: glycosyltransferase [Bellilinea sp.]|jgi:glycosyltransferase involved in cell wall biosynthesis|nr:glycosyltransferase [Bellilinea sp.]
MRNNKNTTISIVTCTLNSEKYLKGALESIENQTYKNIEHIINDSFSTDTTLEIIQEYIERNKDKFNIKFIQSEPKGVGNALNVATREATGDLIHYLHSDDYYLNKYSLEKATSRFNENPDLVWLTGNFLIEVRGKRIAIPQTYLLRVNPEKALSVMNIISHENTFMKREAVQMYGGFNESKNDVVEYSLWLNLIKDHKPLIVNDEFTVFIIHKGSRSTGNLIKFSQAVLRAFRTQRKEMVFPLLGYYADKSFYKQYKQIIKKEVKFDSLLDIEDL